MNGCYTEFYVGETNIWNQDRSLWWLYLIPTIFFPTISMSFIRGIYFFTLFWTWPKVSEHYIWHNQAQVLKLHDLGPTLILYVSTMSCKWKPHFQLGLWIKTHGEEIWGNILPYKRIYWVYCYCSWTSWQESVAYPRFLKLRKEKWDMASEDYWWFWWLST